VGKTFYLEAEAKERYARHLLQTIRGDLKGLRVAIDCANGSAFEIAPMIFRHLGAEVLAFNTEPDGVNINVKCGSTNPDFICRITKENRADLGLAFDGDADRVIGVDSDGNILDGDFIIAICADYLNRQGVLAKNMVATTIMTNLGFDLAMRARGIEVIKTDIGDRFVLEEMLKRGLNLGGEQSGHIIFLDHSTTGDGIITALQLMSIVKKTGFPLKKLREIMKRWPQALINIQIENGQRLERAKRVWEQVRIFEKKLQDRGRILLRPSGTEPLIRIMVETESVEEANSIAEELALIVREELG
jgi:phosphoglucosamine mutase